MDINQYIVRELYRKQEVVLPGFGKFIGSRETAQVDENVVQPPHKKIEFVRDTKSFALDLAMTIATEEKITEDEAAKAINAFVEASNAALTDKGEVVFDGIGTVKLAADGTISFAQVQATSLLADSFGMEAVDLSAISKKTTAETTVTTNNQSSRKGLLWWLLGVAALLLLAFGIWWLVARHLPAQQMAKNAQTQTDTTAVADTSVADIQPSPEQLAATPAKVENEQQAQSTFDSHLQNNRVIYLIVGSFKEPNNATAKQATMTTEGYQSEILDGINGFKRVTIGKFPTADAAMVVYKKFIEAHPSDDIWAL